jgi:chromosome segregation ATPase
MNLEKMSMLSQKIEGVLGTVRALKEENAKIKRELSQAQAMVQDKTLLLESAKHDLADCKAALDARANQANAQQDMLNRQTTQMEALNEKTVVLGQQLVEKDGCIESLESKVRELTSNQELLSGQINERAETVSALNAQVAEKDATIAKLMDQLSEKNALVESLNEQLQAQNEEIAEAQEKFNQLVATIENELGTDIELNDSPSIEPVVEGSEDATAETAEKPSDSDENLVFEDVTAENEEAAEPQMDESVSQEQETEEDVPAIEVHGADENDNDLFASKQEGSQTNFFG